MALIYQLHYKCPLCNCDVKTSVIENLSIKDKNEFSDYQLEYLSANSSDYIGKNVKCRNCNKIVTIPKDVRFYKTHLNFKIGSKKEAMRLNKGGRVYNYGSKFTDSCFIATATFGTSHSNELEYLRKFRDNHLMTNLFGRIFVIMYYYLSPPIARRIENHSFIKHISKNVLLRFIQIIKH